MMRALSVCPNAETLRNYALGRVTEEQAHELERHLEDCGACVQVVESVASRDPLVTALAAPAGPILPSEYAEYAEVLMRHLERLSAVPIPGGSPTVSEGATAPSGAEAAPLAPDLAAFLGSAQQPDELGRLDGYRLLRVLGAGGMGVVFEAEEMRLGRVVAVKVMRPALAASPTARQRFLQEARSAAAIEHEHVVPIYYAGEENGIPFLTMPLLRGETLRDRQRREGKLPIAEVLRIGREVAEALGAAHARGVIHRDIKPTNIWLEAESGRVKVLDFGLARAAVAGEFTPSEVVVGTPAYMAPEQAGKQDLDGRCDLFSLGCVLYLLCTGEPAFRGDDVLSLLMAVANHHPRPPRELNPEVPPALSDLVVSLLAKRPQDRPRSAQAVAAALAALQAGVAPTAPLPVRKLKRRWLVGAGVVLLGGLVGLGGLTLSRRPRTAPPETAPTPRVNPSPDVANAVKPLKARLKVHRLSFDGFNLQRVGELGEATYRARLNDRVTVEVVLSEPAYAYVIAFNPTDKTDGREQLVPETEANRPPKKQDHLSPDTRLIMNDGEGLQVFAVVASRQPLPSYAEWRERRPPLPWQRTRATSGVVWRDDGEGVYPQVEPGLVRATEEVESDKAVVGDLARKLKAMPGVEAVDVVGFAVDPAP
jgi:serine/threonine protein kinase